MCTKDENVEQKYNKCYNDLSTDQEGIDVAELINRIKTYDVPPHIERELGLEKGWRDNLSKEFLSKALKSTKKYNNLLKRLSDK